MSSAVAGKVVKVPVKRSSVLARANRQLARHGSMLKKARPGMTGIGEWYLISKKEGRVVKNDLDFEAFCRELGALDSWQVVVEG